jgi:hypothetical protein
MGYDESKDKKIAGIQINDLEVGIYQYGDNPAKIQFGPRWFKKNDQLFPGKTGRISLEEIDQICTFYQEWRKKNES